MKTKVILLAMLLFSLGFTSCTNDQAETEELYIDSPDDGDVKEKPGES